MAKKNKSAARPDEERTDEELLEVMRTWRTLLPAITTLSETEAKRCIELEKTGEHRKDFILRLHGRFSKLRYERELHTHLKRA